MSVTKGAAQAIGFGVAAAVLLILADIAPRFAIALAALIGLGVVLARAQQLKDLSNAFIVSLGQKPQS